jgi:uncharacterized protein
VKNTFKKFSWLNEPRFWKEEAGSLLIKADEKTDFWRKTHYGFTRDNGHFFYRRIKGDFIVRLKVSGNYTDLYDQAGIMLRQDEKNWIKTGIEWVHGVQQVSAVVTRDYSDWSVRPWSDNPSSIWLKVKRMGDFVEVTYATEDRDYHLLRLAYFPPSDDVLVGMMAAAPDGSGFVVGFSDFSLEKVMG